MIVIGVDCERVIWSVVEKLTKQLKGHVDRPKPNALLLLDDGHARRFGRLLGLRMTGTVGVLARATREGLVPRLAPLLDRLAALGFRLSAQAQAMALTLVGEAP